MALTEYFQSIAEVLTFNNKSLINDKAKVQLT
jgi:hypothetical protein